MMILEGNCFRLASVLFFIHSSFSYRMISETTITYLTVTFSASFLHLLFEYLAFRSDIQFWKDNKSLIGLSIRALFTDLLSQIIIFLYLIEHKTSLLIIVPSFIAIFIQMWKVRMMFSYFLYSFFSRLLF
jgi:hypothetical protein